MHKSELPQTTKDRDFQRFGNVCSSCMLQVIGSPTEADLGFVTSDKARRYLRTLPKMPRSDWRQRYPQVRGCSMGWGC